MASSQRAIAGAFVSHFHNLFSSTCSVSLASLDVIANGPTVAIEHWPSLFTQVTKSEVWDVVSSMGNNKAPGPDGYNALFFKRAWATIGDDVFGAVEEFFVSGKLLKQVNHAFIALVPKVDNPSNINQFRPISCCNVMYKIISKIIANRINLVLDGIVGKEQVAFVRNRKMVDNIRLVQELLRKYARKRISPRCMLKLDLFKAYDTIAWPFLEWFCCSLTSLLGLLLGLWSVSLLHHIVSWLMVECMGFSKVVVASVRAILFHLTYLFCVEYLSRDLRRLQDCLLYQYHPLCAAVDLTHLAYADYLILLSRGDLLSVSVLCTKLQHFSLVSGLKVSHDKSEIFAAGIDCDQLSIIERVTGFDIGKFLF